MNKKIIAGPCSAESQEQILETATQLYNIGIRNFRAGVWKPRTKPGGFEGIGEEALIWMNKIKDKFSDMKIATEIANIDQAKIAMNYNVDIIWVGARTTSDPFAVQELADFFKDSNKEFYIKNPICADYDLWEGAYLRFKNANIKNVGFIHRGFNAFKNTVYRNNPLWRIPLRMKLKYPDVPILCDPSHISGDKKYINEIIEKAWRVYNFDGAMIESHCNPSCALTDAKQQLTPDELKTLLDNFKVINNYDSIEYLNLYRKEINDIDKDLVDLFVKRFAISKKIGKLKKDNNMQVLQLNRFNEILVNLKSMNALSDDFIDNIWQIIHEESIKCQE